MRNKNRLFSGLSILLLILPAMIARISVIRARAMDGLYQIGDSSGHIGGSAKSDRER